jgi:diketogulonate reductase-like aldo/keto reductase
MGTQVEHGPAQSAGPEPGASALWEEVKVPARSSPRVVYSSGKPVRSPVRTAHGRIVNHPDIADMGRRYEVSAPQLSIRYLLQKGAVPLPKATTRDHILANAEVDFEISEADVAVLDAMRDTESHPGAAKLSWS